MRMIRGASLLVLSALLGCTDAPTATDTTPVPPATAAVTVSANVITNATLTQLLASGGRFAESSYMTCILTYYAQGLSLRDIRELCGIQLSLQGQHGWGPGSSAVDDVMKGFDGLAGDPKGVATTCGGADPTISQFRPLERGIMQTADHLMGGINWGDYSWGAPPGGCDRSYCYKNLTEQESEKLKKAAVDAAREAESNARFAEEVAKEAPKSKALQEEAAKLRAEAEAKKKEATKDPNKKPKTTPTPGATSNTGAPDQSTCERVVQVARELIAECNRTDWQRTECQQLHAKMNGCPDPTRIYVDPESGYACAPKVDPELVIAAWTRRCEQLVRPGPDGGSPCKKPVLSDGGFFVEANEDDLCRSPIARTDPEHDGCIATLEVDTFGQTDIDELIVWAQGVFGGPIVVLPKPPLPFPL